MEPLVIVFIVALAIKVIVKVRAEEKYAAKHSLLGNGYKNKSISNDGRFIDRLGESDDDLSGFANSPVSLDISVFDD